MLKVPEGQAVYVVRPVLAAAAVPKEDAPRMLVYQRRTRLKESDPYFTIYLCIAAADQNRLSEKREPLPPSKITSSS
jgi:hypothetical protein